MRGDNDKYDKYLVYEIFKIYKVGIERNKKN